MISNFSECRDVYVNVEKCGEARGHEWRHNMAHALHAG